MQFDKDLSKDKLLIKLFRFVQEIPYRVTPFEKTNNSCKEPVTTSIKQGDCRHKTLLLHNLLRQSDFEIEKVKVIFDWKDLPIPQKIINILKKSTTRWSHDTIKMITGKHSFCYIDPTWNPELLKLGFPITKRWDGKENTEQITNGKLEYFPAENFKKEDHKIIIDKTEAQEFGQALNKWLNENTN